MLKIVASLARESMLQAFHRLVQLEYDRLFPGRAARGNADAHMQEDQT